jgi:hypothetical protein
MELTSALIIYFALGVPFGVLSSYLRSPRLEASDLGRVIYHLAFWPFIAVVRAFSRAGDQGSMIAAKANLDRHSTAVDPIAISLHRCVRKQEAIVEGLDRALRASVSATELRLPFLECIENPNSRLAAKCFQRRNIAKLELHIIEARRVLTRSQAALRSFESDKPVPFGTGEREHPVRDMC